MGQQSRVPGRSYYFQGISQPTKKHEALSGVSNQSHLIRCVPDFQWHGGVKLLECKFVEREEAIDIKAYSMGAVVTGIILKLGLRV